MDKWSNEKTLLFINSIHLRPELWDVENQKYKDRNIKKDSWQRVAAEFGISVDDAYKKVRSLRTYAKSDAKKRVQKSGSSAGSTSNWFAFNAISFILSRDVPETGLDSLNTRETISENSFTNTEVELDSEMGDGVEVSIDTATTVEQPSTSPCLHPTRKRKRSVQQQSEERPEAIQRAIEIVNNASLRRNNPFSSFSDNVAQKLLSYNKIPAMRSEVEFNISKLLYEADMRLLQLESEQQSSSVVDADVPILFEHSAHDYEDIINHATVVIEDDLQDVQE